MAALIRGCHNFSIDEWDKILNNEDLFYELWGQTKYYLETVNQVNFK